jgi:hypothetical protein
VLGLVINRAAPSLLRDGGLGRSTRAHVSRNAFVRRRRPVHRSQPVRRG